MPRDTKGKPVKDDGMVHMERKAKGDNMLGAGSKYPHGLRVHVDHEGLKKLDMDELPQVGHSVEMRAKAQVMGVHMEEGEDGQPRHRLEMQITHMGLHHKSDGMKSEDQGGSGKTPEAGHVTDKGNKGGGDTAKEKMTGKDASYGRKRH
ncbi:capsid staple protein [Burkholderia metallica]|uniref:capsid staple protein n=1 Tax=Burkholderia metallica TaxID=488729 RepID=UPI001CF2E984|nr:hypothetical protein [Burkholderia metallica]MCA8018087.1 hypothetical protein [Burkholderia metallica]